MTPQTRTGSRGYAGRLCGRFALTVLLMASLAACSSGAGRQPGPEPTASKGSTSAAAATAASSASAQATPATATARLQRTMADALGSLAAGNPKPGTEQITAALTAAGVPARTLEVSAGRTPTGLDVDSIEAASVQGKDCVFGQIRDGKVTVTVLPVLSNGKCFVGAPA
jgi:hypothetical protein